MRILLVDTSLYHPLSPFFLAGLEELSTQPKYEWEFVDEGKFLRPLERSLVHKAAYRFLGRRPVTYWSLNRTLLAVANRFRPNVVLVVKGAYVSPATLRCIKQETDAFLVNYATDDPFNSSVNTRDLVNGIPLYDLYACTKRAIMDDVRKAGCKHVIYVPFGYKPSVHFPEKPRTPEEKNHFASDVVFVGTFDPERIPYFEALIRSLPDISLHLYGGDWGRHPVLRRYHRGFATGREYRLALGGTKIALHFVRHANRDGHSLRTFEIPACGAFMLAERTEDHLVFFQEDKEVVLFSTPLEMIEKISYYLKYKEERTNIMLEGHKKVVSCAHTYTDRLRHILSVAEGML
jgi:spore maturation protein CgeB